MHTVHAPASPFNPLSHGPRHAVDGNAPSLLASNLADDCTIDLADDDARAAAYWAEFEQGMQAAEDDRAIQAADEIHAATIAAAVRCAKELIGTAEVTITRQQHVSSAGVNVDYYAKFERSIVHTCTGPTPDVAVTNAVSTLDLIYLTAEFGGFNADHLAFVSGFPFRKREEAQQLARRIVLDRSYLDIALAMKIEGITDLRPRPTTAAAVAA